jgi:hydrogenase expression/formation protein HypE
LLARAPLDDPRIVVGPGVGLDCAVVEVDDILLVCKSDPITFVSGALGHYLVQVNANEVATTGAIPRWLLVTARLPERRTTAESAEHLLEEIYAACRAQDIAVIGGHTEITCGIDRPIAVGTLLGTVTRDKLITPRGAKPGDRLLLTKTVPIEGTSILAREYAGPLRAALTEEELITVRNFLVDPGISVVPDARIALGAGVVTAMHDPTEGGVSAALWELAEASGRLLHVDLARVPVAQLSARICAVFGIDPLETIASGALLITSPRGDAARIKRALEEAGIPCHEIGEVRDGPPAVYHRTGSGEERLAWPERDGVARVFEAPA